MWTCLPRAARRRRKLDGFSETAAPLRYRVHFRPQARDPYVMDGARRDGSHVDPVQKCWQLNERHYGSLQGLNKAEVEAEFGQEQVELWRRSYAVRPPKLEPEDERYPHHDSRYRQLRPDQLPLSESLKDTLPRASGPVGSTQSHRHFTRIKQFWSSLMVIVCGLL